MTNYYLVFSLKKKNIT